MNGKPAALEALWAILPALIGLVFVLCVFYPGYMSADSLDQLTQGRENSYNDWHPPIMSWVWGRLDQIVPGPFGMLLFHNLLFWAGLGLFMNSAVPKWPGYVKAILILLIGFFPPVLMLLSTIWKDVGMASAFLFGTGLLIHTRKYKSIPSLAIALISIWYGLSIRINGIIAAAPLIIFAVKIPYDLGYFPKWKSGNKIVHVLLSAIALIGAMFFSTKMMESVLTRNTTTYPIQQVWIHDLVGISVQLKEVLLPEYLLGYPSPTQRELIRIYTPGTVNHLFWGDGGRIRLELTNDPVLISDLFSTWRSVVLDHPKAYSIHRIKVFSRQFWITGNRVCYPYHYGILPNSLDIEERRSKTMDLFFTWVESLTTTLLYRGWVYLSMALFVVIYGCEYALLNRLSLPWPDSAMALSTSGLFYGLAYLFISPACDFRLHYWIVISAILSATVILHSRVRSSKTRLASPANNSS